ncbi:hypothetical protein BCR44DRAFT_1512168 [Catenaria anguillulae PL171]|uniref:Cytochrome b561 domain-containing protein n=1 Tax=Catenaria anguillulae PL171 TaxID=765915 RepID=A0A1Y2HSD7_9FUNG|nr:hypothetical protein BCR44DRAFT_1512168 [Catenaria anguillulae PL171]
MSTRRSVTVLLATLLLAFLAAFVPTAAARDTKCFNNNQLCLSPVRNGTNVDVVLQFSTLGWVAFGLAPNADMSAADVVVVWTRNGPEGILVNVSDRWSSGYNMPRADAVQDWNVIAAGKSPADNKFLVTIRRAITTSEPAVDLPFKDEEQQFIWALSTQPVEIENGKPQFNKHSEYGPFKMNMLKFDAASEPAGSGQGLGGNVQSDGTMSREKAVFIHGLCMAIAWGFLSYLAVFVARFMKTKLGAWWFRLHWGIMLVVAALSVTAVVILVMSPVGHSWFSSAHAIVGTLVFGAMWVQIIVGIVIDRMYEPARTFVPIRDKIHWAIGYILALGGPTAILLGLLHESAGMPLIGAYIATWVMFIALFAFGSYQLPKKVVDPVRTTPMSKEDHVSLDSLDRPSGSLHHRRRDSATNMGMGPSSSGTPSRPSRPLDLDLSGAPGGSNFGTGSSRGAPESMSPPRWNAPGSAASNANQFPPPRSPRWDQSQQDQFPPPRSPRWDDPGSGPRSPRGGYGQSGSGSRQQRNEYGAAPPAPQQAYYGGRSDSPPPRRGHSMERRADQQSYNQYQQYATQQPQYSSQQRQDQQQRYQQQGGRY